MKLKLLFLAGLVFASGLLYAQTDFWPGYVITAKGDTLRGQIDRRGDVSLGELCRFRTGEGAEEVKYTAADIKGYRFEEDKYYVSKPVNGEQVFLEFLVNGAVKLYYLRNAEGDNYFLEKEGEGLTRLPYEEVIHQRDKKLYQQKSKAHIGILSYYMQDAPGLKTRIVNIGKPERRKLASLVKDYHQEVSGERSFRVYEKKDPLITVNLELVGGVVSYNQAVSDYIHRNYFQTGVITQIKGRSLNEKLHIRTGLLFSNLESKEGSQHVLKIPLQLGYTYPKGFVRPKVAAGINFYMPFFQSVAFMGGLNFPLHKSVSLVVNYDVDFVPAETFPLFPSHRLSQSLLSGIQINF